MQTSHATGGLWWSTDLAMSSSHDNIWRVENLSPKTHSGTCVLVSIALCAKTQTTALGTWSTGEFCWGHAVLHHLHRIKTLWNESPATEAWFRLPSVKQIDWAQCQEDETTSWRLGTLADQIRPTFIMEPCCPSCAQARGSRGVTIIMLSKENTSWFRSALICGSIVRIFLWSGSKTNTANRFVAKSLSTGHTNSTAPAGVSTSWLTAIPEFFFCRTDTARSYMMDSTWLDIEQSLKRCLRVETSLQMITTRLPPSLLTHLSPCLPVNQHSWLLGNVNRKLRSMHYVHGSKCLSGG